MNIGTLEESNTRNIVAIAYRNILRLTQAFHLSYFLQGTKMEMETLDWAQEANGEEFFVYAGSYYSSLFDCMRSRECSCRQLDHFDLTPDEVEQHKKEYLKIKSLVANYIGKHQIDKEADTPIRIEVSELLVWLSTPESSWVWAQGGLDVAKTLEKVMITGRIIPLRVTMNFSAVSLRPVTKMAQVLLELAEAYGVPIQIQDSWSDFNKWTPSMEKNIPKIVSEQNWQSMKICLNSQFERNKNVSLLPHEEQKMLPEHMRLQNEIRQLNWGIVMGKNFWRYPDVKFDEVKKIVFTIHPMEGDNYKRTRQEEMVTPAHKASHDRMIKEREERMIIAKEEQKYIEAFERAEQRERRKKEQERLKQEAIKRKQLEEEEAEKQKQRAKEEAKAARLREKEKQRKEIENAELTLQQRLFQEQTIRILVMCIFILVRNNDRKSELESYEMVKERGERADKLQRYRFIAFWTLLKIVMEFGLIILKDSISEPDRRVGPSIIDIDWRELLGKIKSIIGTMEVMVRGRTKAKFSLNTFNSE